MRTEWTEVAPGVMRVHDTCEVYAVITEHDGERTAVAVDFGSGMVLDLLQEWGVARITDVVMTHHHRDQAQGLPSAVAHGARVHVPPTEKDLFSDVSEMWRTRNVLNDYNLRQDRFSIFDDVAVHDTVPVYRRLRLPGVELDVRPTPGHTMGSVTYLLERAGYRIAFSGDLIYAPGKVWSLAATQWSYTENEGPAMTVLSCMLLADEHPDLLLPSHGEPMDEPVLALERLAAMMQEYIDSRRVEPWDLRERLHSPYVAITPHLLRNRASMATSYVLLSDTGEALMIDFGYDMTTGLPAGTDRASRLPWLASLPALRRDFGVTHISVALPTHYHDDHVAGLNLLRDVEGTEVWSPSNVAPILDAPGSLDLPCQYWDPIRSDRVLDLGDTVTWNEYSITVHPLPGHTLYAAAFEVEVDGVRMLFTGDQQTNDAHGDRVVSLPNYQYRNLFRPDDYQRSADLYRRVAPGLLITGHWAQRAFDGQAQSELDAVGAQTQALHEMLLPEDIAIPASGFAARLEPYVSQIASGARQEFTAWVANPFHTDATVDVVPVVPVGWRVEPEHLVGTIPADGRADFQFVVTVGDERVPRQRVGIDVTIGSLRLGQHCEALVDIG